MYTHVYICVCAFLYLRTYIYIICIFVYICIYMYIYLYIYVYTYMYIYIYMCVLVCVYIYICACIYIEREREMYRYMYVCIFVLASFHTPCRELWERTFGFATQIKRTDWSLTCEVLTRDCCCSDTRQSSYELCVLRQMKPALWTCTNSPYMNPRGSWVHIQHIRLVGNVNLVVFLLIKDSRVSTNGNFSTQ